jgi:hypothetical protein
MGESDDAAGEPCKPGKNSMREARLARESRGKKKVKRVDCADNGVVSAEEVARDLRVVPGATVGRFVFDQVFVQR